MYIHAAGPILLSAYASSGANIHIPLAMLLNNSMCQHTPSASELSTLVLSARELDSFLDFYSGYLRILAVIPDVRADQYCVLSDIDSESRLCFYLSC